MATNIANTAIEKAANNLIDLANTANEYVLDTTEQVFDIAFSLTNKSIDTTSKIVNKGLEVSATQQECAFDLLNSLKKKIFRN